MIACGNQTAGSFKFFTFLAASNIGWLLSGISSNVNLNGLLGSLAHLIPPGLPAKSPLAKCVIRPEPTQSPWFSP